MSPPAPVTLHPFKNKGVCQTQNAGKKLKTLAVFSNFSESRPSNCISSAYTHHHYSLRNAGECHSIKPKWLMLYIVYEYSVQFLSDSENEKDPSWKKNLTGCGTAAMFFHLHTHLLSHRLPIAILP